MDNLNLRIADLRRQKGITQQTLAEIVGVSFQTISKWENGGAHPDITYLPILSKYFGVTIDQLMGIEPFESEKYIENPTVTDDFWNKKLEYLIETRKGRYNSEYLEMMIHKVWNIDRPIQVLDCGCGYGFLGLTLMPYLPEGSEYTGIDFADNLIEKGREMLKDKGFRYHLVKSNIYEYNHEGMYDLVICQGVLRHVDSAERCLNKMKSFARPGGIVTCIESNREFECDGLYIDGMDYFELCRKEGLKKKWRVELENQGRDYAAAIRAAHIMRKIGLKNIDVRMNDKVEFNIPENENYVQKRDSFLKSNDWNAGLTSEERKKAIARLLTNGMNREEAEEYVDRNLKISDFFDKHPDAGYTFVKGTMITFGRK